jgi:hypothetical protein
MREGRGSVPATAPTARDRKPGGAGRALYCTSLHSSQRIDPRHGQAIRYAVRMPE